jgi:hypothetical protein
VRRLVVAKLTGSVVLVAACGLVLWIRQSADALLRVDSYGEAVAQVGFWVAPTALLYLVLPRSRRPSVEVAVILTVVLVLQRWASATDWHSTASIGPGMVGWLFGPALVLVAAALERQRSRSR